MEKLLLAIALSALCGVIGLPVAGAHGGEDPLSAAHIARMWTWDPLVLAGLMFAGSLYTWGVRALWRSAGRGHGVRRWEVLCYAAGLLTVFIALISPLDGLSDTLFSAHMSQHEA